MVRLPRFEKLGQSKHLVIRCNTRQIIFVADKDKFPNWETGR